MQRKFMQNGVVLEYTFEYKAVKNINLRVRTDGSVYVSAPKKVPIKAVESFISSNFDRIMAAREKFAGLREAEEGQEAQVFSDGMSVRILGENALVRLEESAKTKVEFDPSEHILHIFLPEISSDSAEKLYKDWTREYSREIFAEILEKLHPKFAPYGVPKPTLRVREMKTRWGSCIPSKEIVTLNTRLLEYPAECIEYVAVHELCHFKEANHSARFYGWMDKMLPDWWERKKKLSNR